MIAPLLGVAVLNSGFDLASATEYRAAEALGLSPAVCGAVVLGSDIRTLLDLNAAYGPATALWVPVLTTALTHLGAVVLSAPGLPAFASVVVSGITWVLCRKGLGSCSLPVS